MEITYRKLLENQEGLNRVLSDKTIANKIKNFRDRIKFAKINNQFIEHSKNYSDASDSIRANYKTEDQKEQFKQLHETVVEIDDFPTIPLKHLKDTDLTPGDFSDLEALGIVQFEEE